MNGQDPKPQSHQSNQYNYDKRKNEFFYGVYQQEANEENEQKKLQQSKLNKEFLADIKNRYQEVISILFCYCGTSLALQDGNLLDDIFIQQETVRSFLKEKMTSARREKEIKEERVYQSQRRKEERKSQRLDIGILFAGITITTAFFIHWIKK